MSWFANRSRTELALLAAFLTAFIFSLWAASVGWRHPIIDEHSFRQTQTALTVYYLVRGGPFLAYETPVLGPPWSIPFEFPFYQWVVAKTAILTGWPLEICGRFVARLFFYLGLIPLWFIARRFASRREHAWAFLAIYLLSPLFLFWSRTFLIESTAVTLALAYFAAAAEGIRRPSRRALALAALFGMLAAAVKITTFAAFGLAAGLLWICEIWKTRAWESPGRLRAGILWPGVSAFALPFVALLLWTNFSDAQKALNPLAGFILSDSLKTWNFGTLEQRLSGDFWYMIFRKHMHGAIGHRTTWILSMLAIWFAPKRARALYFIGLVLFVTPPLLFTNLHKVHEYYAMANVAFLVFALGICVSALLADKRKPAQAAGGMLFVVGLGLAVRAFLGQPYHVQKADFSPPTQMAEQIKGLVPAEDVILIYGYDWHPMLPYYSERRAIMNRDRFPMDSDEMQKSLALLGERKVGAAVFCDRKEQDDALLKEIRKFIPLAAKPAVEGWCRVYVRK